MEILQAQTVQNSVVDDVQSRRVADSFLGKDEFLRILITQLQNQNPISPVEDKEFIAQMAQFSSLEQITNLSNEFSKLSASLSGAQSLQLLGRHVEIDDNGLLVQGVVSSVTTGSNPSVSVQNRNYSIDSILRITQ